MTKWAGAAWRVLVKDRDFIKRLFQKTGCLLNNYWMRLSMLEVIIKAKVCVIC